MRQAKRLLVTGGCGFIGSAFVRWSLHHRAGIERVVNLDLLTYAGNETNVGAARGDPRYLFVQGDVCDKGLVSSLCGEYRIDTIVHFAAESHVDRSIEAPHLFYQTNIGGTIALLDAVRGRPHIHFHHISTDEVYGSLGQSGAFNESSPYAPNSPYAASKAGSDHFVRAYTMTYGISTTLSHCSNNYGPYQYKEKLIPCLIAQALMGEPLPIYGDGSNRRDWLFVDDHVEAIWQILERGRRGEVYDIGGGRELSNLELAHILLAKLAGQTTSRIGCVPDRPGHDFRYAIDCTKIQEKLAWKAKRTFEEGLSETIAWYLAHPEFLHRESVRC